MLFFNENGVRTGAEAVGEGTYVRFRFVRVPRTEVEVKVEVEVEEGRGKRAKR